MLYQLLRRDSAWRVTPYLVLIGGAAPLFLRGREWLVMAPILFCALWTSTAALVRMQQRTTLFEAGLPIAGRHLYLGRTLALLGYIWLPLLAAAVSLAIVNPGTPGAFTSIFGMGMVMTVSVLALQAIRIQEFSGPIWLLFLTLPVFTLMCVLLFQLPWMINTDILVCAMASVALFARNWLSVPKSFQSAPVHALSVSEGRSGYAPQLPFWPVCRALFRWQTAIMFPILLLYPLTNDWSLPLIWVGAVFSQAQPGFRWLFTIPIRRRTLLLVLLIPCVMLISAGYLVSINSGLSSQFGAHLVFIGYTPGQSPDFKSVQVPLAFWRVTGRLAPVIRSPWGEQHQPQVLRKFGIGFYNPFSTGPESSAPFVRWQLERASQAVHGGNPASKPVLLRARIQIITLSLILACSLIVVFAAHLTLWSRLNGISKPVLTVLATLLIGFPMLPILVNTFAKLDFANRRAPTDFLLLRLSENLPSNLWLMILLLGAFVAALFWMVEWQFEEVELANPPSLSAT